MVPGATSVLVLVNVQVRPVQLGALMLAVGFPPVVGPVTTTDSVVLAVAPLALVTVSCTLYVPAALKRCTGFWSVEALLAVPEFGSPKFQLHAVISPAGVLASVKVQDSSVHV
jgi:hypothetical protein